METAWTWTAGLVLAAWLAASAVHQLRLTWWTRVERRDALNLLPRWSFFAPNPGRHDMHLVCRERAGHRIGPWRSLSPNGDDLRWRWIWQPSRYPRKAVHDLANGLIQSLQAHAETPRAVLLTSCYLSVLQRVMAEPTSDPEATHRQFALIATGGRSDGPGPPGLALAEGDPRELTVRFVSEEHALGR